MPPKTPPTRSGNLHGRSADDAEGQAYAPPKGTADATARREGTIALHVAALPPHPRRRFIESALQLPCRPIPGHHDRGFAPDRGGGTTAPWVAPRRRPLPSLSWIDAGVQRQPPRPATARPADGGARRHTQQQISMKLPPIGGRCSPPPSLRDARVVPVTRSDGGTVGKRGVGGGGGG
jgi:hypothetical protein